MVAREVQFIRETYLSLKITGLLTLFHFCFSMFEYKNSEESAEPLDLGSVSTSILKIPYKTTLLVVIMFKIIRKR